MTFIRLDYIETLLPACHLSALPEITSAFHGSATRYMFLNLIATPTGTHLTVTCSHTNLMSVYIAVFPRALIMMYPEN